MTIDESIAELAYRLWLARGRPHGSAEEDWLEAERRLRRTAPADVARGASEHSVDSSLAESFPASDPPASHQADTPPSNAADKWIAAGKSASEPANSTRTPNNPALSRTDKAPEERPRSAPGRGNGNVD